MQLPQSTVSRHLKALADSGWIAARAEGTSNVYAMTRDELDPSARRLWALVREQVGPTPAAVHDQRRVQRVLAERRTKSQEFFSSSAGQWDRAARRSVRRARFTWPRCPRSRTPSGRSAISVAARAR